MPEIKVTKYRLWCKTCKDFKIHDKIYDDGVQLFNKGPFKILCECKTEFTDIKLSEISEDKILEQRKRFKENRSLKFRQRLATYTKYFADPDSFDVIERGEDLVEDDAGLLVIEAQEKAKKLEDKITLSRELEKFKNVNRNDICLCGSNKKYKKCCIIRHNK